MEERLNYKAEQLNNALVDFSRSLSIDISELEDVVCDAVKSGQVQKFEFTVELLWKVTKIFLEETHGFDEKSPKSVIKRFFLLDYLEQSDYEAFIDSINDRNRLSHIYNKAQFEEIRSRLPGYCALFTRIYGVIRES